MPRRAHGSEGNGWIERSVDVMVEIPGKPTTFDGERQKPEPHRFSSLIETLSRTTLFVDLAPDELLSVVERGQIVAVKKDAAVIREGVSNDTVFFVISGTFTCRKSSPNGLLFVLDNSVKPGDFFGELSLIGDGACDLEVVALAEARLLAIPGTSFRALMEQYPTISRRMIEEMAVRIGKLSNLSFELATMKVDTRLRRVIEKLARESNQLHDGGIIRPAPTHAELATLVGTTREVVSRSMVALCRQGSIKTSRKEILIRSVNRLNVQADLRA